jgi:hypothetical protein
MTSRQQRRDHGTTEGDASRRVISPIIAMWIIASLLAVRNSSSLLSRR